MKFKELMNEEKHDKFWFEYLGIKVNINTKNKGNAKDHVRRRLKTRGLLTVEQFQEKMKKAIDKMLKINEQGRYYLLFKKSKIKSLVKFTPIRNDAFIVTIFDITMIVNDYDFKIVLDESYITDYIFNIYGKSNIENNSCSIVEEGFHDCLVFKNTNNKKTVEWVDKIVIDI